MPGYDELIDKYLFGKMSEKEEQIFLHKCKTNKKLREEAVATAYLIKGLKKYGVR